REQLDRASIRLGRAASIRCALLTELAELDPGCGTGVDVVRRVVCDALECRELRREAADPALRVLPEHVGDRAVAATQQQLSLLLTGESIDQHATGLGQHR